MKMKSENDSQPALLVVTGASGARKTTLVRGVEVLGIPGLRWVINLIITISTGHNITLPSNVNTS